MITMADLRKQPHWSYSAVNCYLNICSLQYYFRYIEHAESEQTSVVLPFGRAFHAAASEQALKAGNGECLTKPELVDVFASCFKVECDETDNLKFKHGDTVDSLIDKAADMLDELLACWFDFNNLIGVAVPFKMNMTGLSKPLIGEFDLVIKEQSYPVIVDWKTAACSWSQPKADRDLQATCFCYAYEKMHNTKPSFRFDVVTKNKQPKFCQLYTERDADAFARFEAIVLAVEQAVNAGIFLPAETSHFCGDCPYASRCKSWPSAAPSRVAMEGRHHKQARSMFLPLAG